MSWWRVPKLYSLLHCCFCAADRQYITDVHDCQLLLQPRYQQQHPQADQLRLRTTSQQGVGCRGHPGLAGTTHQLPRGARSAASMPGSYAFRAAMRCISLDCQSVPSSDDDEHVTAETSNHCMHKEGDADVSMQSPDVQDDVKQTVSSTLPVDHSSSAPCSNDSRQGWPQQHESQQIGCPQLAAVSTPENEAPSAVATTMPPQAAMGRTPVHPVFGALTHSVLDSTSTSSSTALPVAATHMHHRQQAVSSDGCRAASSQGMLAGVHGDLQTPVVCEERMTADVKHTAATTEPCPAVHCKPPVLLDQPRHADSSSSYSAAGTCLQVSVGLPVAPVNCDATPAAAHCSSIDTMKGMHGLGTTPSSGLISAHISDPCDDISSSHHQDKQQSPEVLLSTTSEPPGSAVNTAAATARCQQGSTAAAHEQTDAVSEAATTSAPPVRRGRPAPRLPKFMMMQQGPSRISSPLTPTVAPQQLSVAYPPALQPDQVSHHQFTPPGTAPSALLHVDHVSLLHKNPRPKSARQPPRLSAFCTSAAVSYPGGTASGCSLTAGLSTEARPWHSQYATPVNHAGSVPSSASLHALGQPQQAAGHLLSVDDDAGCMRPSGQGMADVCTLSFTAPLAGCSSEVLSCSTDSSMLRHRLSDVASAGASATALPPTEGVYRGVWPVYQAASSPAIADGGSMQHHPTWPTPSYCIRGVGVSHVNASSSSISAVWCNRHNTPGHHDDAVAAAVPYTPMTQQLIQEEMQSMETALQQYKAIKDSVSYCMQHAGALRQQLHDLQSQHDAAADAQHMSQQQELSSTCGRALVVEHPAEQHRQTSAFQTYGHTLGPSLPGDSPGCMADRPPSGGAIPLSHVLQVQDELLEVEAQLQLLLQEQLQQKPRLLAISEQIHQLKTAALARHHRGLQSGAV